MVDHDVGRGRHVSVARGHRTGVGARAGPDAICTAMGPPSHAAPGRTAVVACAMILRRHDPSPRSVRRWWPCGPFSFGVRLRFSSRCSAPAIAPRRARPPAAPPPARRCPRAPVAPSPRRRPPGLRRTNHPQRPFVREHLRLCSRPLPPAGRLPPSRPRPPLQQRSHRAALRPLSCRARPRRRPHRRPRPRRHQRPRRPRPPRRLPSFAPSRLVSASITR